MSEKSWSCCKDVNKCKTLSVTVSVVRKVKRVGWEAATDAKTRDFDLVIPKQRENQRLLCIIYVREFQMNSKNLNDFRYVLNRLDDLISAGTVSNKCVDRDVMGIFEESVGDGIVVARENITGIKLETQENLGNEFSKALMTTLKLESLRLILPWLLSPFLFYVYRLLTGNKDVFKTLHKLPKYVLQQKRLKYEENKLSENDQPKTLIDMLFQIRKLNPEFTEKQMHDEMLNMIATGSESTAVTGSFVLLMLAMNTDCQEKVFEEVVQILGSNDTNVDIKKLNEMRYLEQCIQETLRIFTLFPLTLRKTTEEVKLVDNRVIPPNCQVAMALHGVHFDPILYPNPKKWNPQNFTQEAIESRPKHSFMAFGCGPRACIGAKYALISLKTQIAHIILKYRIRTEIQYTDLRPVMDAIVRNKYGYPINSCFGIQEIGTKCSHRETLGLVKETLLDGIITQELMQVDKDIPFDVWPYVINASVDAITENISGVKVKTQKQFGNEYSEALVKILQLIVKRATTILLHPKFTFCVYILLSGQHKIIKILHNFPKEAFKLARRHIQERNRLKDIPSKTALDILLERNAIDL
ncbi:hypothetical protein PGB90_006856 [Kerria lacca]